MKWWWSLPLQTSTADTSERIAAACADSANAENEHELANSCELLSRSLETLSEDNVAALSKRLFHSEEAFRQPTGAVLDLIHLCVRSPKFGSVFKQACKQSFYLEKLDPLSSALADAVWYGDEPDLEAAYQRRMLAFQHSGSFQHSILVEILALDSVTQTASVLNTNDVYDRMSDAELEFLAAALSEEASCKADRKLLVNRIKLLSTSPITSLAARKPMSMNQDAVYSANSLEILGRVAFPKGDRAPQKLAPAVTSALLLSSFAHTKHAPTIWSPLSDSMSESDLSALKMLLTRNSDQTSVALLSGSGSGRAHLLAQVVGSVLASRPKSRVLVVTANSHGSNEFIRRVEGIYPKDAWEAVLASTAGGSEEDPYSASRVAERLQRQHRELSNELKSLLVQVEGKSDQRNLSGAPAASASCQSMLRALKSTSAPVEELARLEATLEALLPVDVLSTKALESLILVARSRLVCVSQSEFLNSIDHWSSERFRCDVAVLEGCADQRTLWSAGRVATSSLIVAGDARFEPYLSRLVALEGYPKVALDHPESVRTDDSFTPGLASNAESVVWIPKQVADWSLDWRATRAEFVAATYMFLRLAKVPAREIGLLTTDDEQTKLLRDILKARCDGDASMGTPRFVETCRPGRVDAVATLLMDAGDFEAHHVPLEYARSLATRTFVHFTSAAQQTSESALSIVLDEALASVTGKPNKGAETRAAQRVTSCRDMGVIVARLRQLQQARSRGADQVDVRGTSARFAAADTTRKRRTEDKPFKGRDSEKRPRQGGRR